jgi:hypothetical protein
MQGKAALKETYAIGMSITAWSTAFATFFGCWGLAVWKFGWLLGLLLGWLPAIVIAGVVAYVAGLLWPLLVIAVPILLWSYFRMRGA